MKSLKSGLVIIGSVGLLFLGACSNGNQAANPNKSPASSPSAAISPSTTAKTESQGKSKGGQVVESGSYHLELVAEPESNGTHIDFYLQRGDNHEAIPNAKVTAQVQLPDGGQKTLDLNYDAEGRHYAALLPEKATGQYQVKMSADVNGEKVDGRFSFNK